MKYSSGGGGNIFDADPDMMFAGFCQAKGGGGVDGPDREICERLSAEIPN